MTAPSASGAPDGRARGAGAVAACAALVVLALGLVWAGGAAWGGRFLEDLSPGRDIYHLSTFYERWAHHVFRGHLPAWLPEFQGGYPLPAAGMYGLFYPGHLLFGVLRAETAWTWAVLLHAALAAAGACRLVHEETHDRVAGIASGVVLGSCEFVAGRALCGHLNLVAPFAWMPWVLHFVSLAGRGRRGAGLLAGVCAAAGLLAGHVQVWFLVAPFAAGLAVVRWMRATDRRAASRELGIAALVALGLSAIQWMATAELVAATGRTPLTDAEIAGTSAPLAAVVAKLFPGALGTSPADAWGAGIWQHEFTGIGGLFLVPLVVAALMRRREGAVFWLVVAGSGLLLAPGVTNAVSAAVNGVPPFSWGRTPGRALLLTALGASVLAGHGVAAIRAAAGESAEALRRLVVAGGVATVVAAAAGCAALAGMLGAGALGEHSDIAGTAMLVSTSGALVVVAAVAMARRAARPGVALIASVAVACALAAPRAGTIPAAFYHSAWTAALPSDVAAGRVRLLDERMPNVERLGVRSLREACYVDMPEYREFLRNAPSERLRWLDVRADLTGIDPARFASPDTGPGDVRGRPVPGIGAGLVFARAAAAASDAAALAALDRGATVALLADAADETDADRTAARSGTPSGPLARRVVAEPSPGPDSLRLRVDAGPAGWLVLSERWFPGWVATVDGAPVQIVRMNVTLRAVRVPDRACEVAMEYRPPLARAGRLVSAVTACVVAVSLALAWSRRRQA